MKVQSVWRDMEVGPALRQKGPSDNDGSGKRQVSFRQHNNNYGWQLTPSGG